jgi:hypothetical protein
MPPGIDILHELGNRALSGSKKPRRRRTLQTFGHREPQTPLCDASATGSTVRCQHPNFDFRTLNFTTDVTLTDEDFAAILNSTDPDLRLLRAHGGKIIHLRGMGGRSNPSGKQR